MTSSNRNLDMDTENKEMTNQEQMNRRPYHV